MRENLPVFPSVHADLKTSSALVSSDSVVPIFCRWLYRHLRTLCVARSGEPLAHAGQPLARAGKALARPGVPLPRSGEPLARAGESTN
jgi:hypothetical protein